MHHIFEIADIIIIIIISSFQRWRCKFGVIAGSGLTPTQGLNTTEGSQEGQFMILIFECIVFSLIIK